MADDNMGKILPFKRQQKKPSQLDKVPLDTVFKGKPPYRLKKNDYEKNTYTHGDHRVVGHPAMMVSTVIDDSSWWKIKNLKSGQSHEFKDETDAEWRVERDVDTVKFFQKDSYGDERQRSEGSWREMVDALN